MDEAQRCLKFGKEVLDSGDKFRALKILLNARRLNPNLDIADLLSSCINDSNDTTTNQTKKAEEIASSTLKSKVSSNGSSSQAYTEEQITIIEQIRKKKDSYDILGLDRNSTAEDIRKAYRKLSLKVHPDKNKAPGAEEAFKAVSRSFQCLSK